MRWLIQDSTFYETPTPPTAGNLGVLAWLEAVEGLAQAFNQCALAYGRWLLRQAFRSHFHQVSSDSRMTIDWGSSPLLAGVGIRIIQSLLHYAAHAFGVFRVENGLPSLSEDVWWLDLLRCQTEFRPAIPRECLPVLVDTVASMFYSPIFELRVGIHFTRWVLARPVMFPEGVSDLSSPNLYTTMLFCCYSSWVADGGRVLDVGDAVPSSLTVPEGHTLVSPQFCGMSKLSTKTVTKSISASENDATYVTIGLNDSMLTEYALSEFSRAQEAKALNVSRTEKALEETLESLTKSQNELGALQDEECKRNAAAESPSAGSDATADEDAGKVTSEILVLSSGLPKCKTIAVLTVMVHVLRMKEEGGWKCFSPLGMLEAGECKSVCRVVLSFLQKYPWEDLVAADPGPFTPAEGPLGCMLTTWLVNAFSQIMSAYMEVCVQRASTHSWPGIWDVASPVFFVACADVLRMVAQEDNDFNTILASFESHPYTDRLKTHPLVHSDWNNVTLSHDKRRMHFWAVEYFYSTEEIAGSGDYSVLQCPLDRVSVHRVFLGDLKVAEKDVEWGLGNLEGSPVRFTSASILNERPDVTVIHADACPPGRPMTT